MCTHICTDPWQIMILKTHWRVIGYRLVQIPSRNGSENPLTGYWIQTGTYPWQNWF